MFGEAVRETPAAGVGHLSKLGASQPNMIFHLKSKRRIVYCLKRQDAAAWDGVKSKQNAA